MDVRTRACPRETMHQPDPFKLPINEMSKPLSQKEIDFAKKNFSLHTVGTVVCFFLCLDVFVKKISFLLHTTGTVLSRLLNQGTLSKSEIFLCLDVRNHCSLMDFTTVSTNTNTSSNSLTR